MSSRVWTFHSHISRVLLQDKAIHGQSIELYSCRWPPRSATGVWSAAAYARSTDASEVTRDGEEGSLSGTSSRSPPTSRPTRPRTLSCGSQVRLFQISILSSLIPVLRQVEQAETSGTNTSSGSARPTPTGSSHTPPSPRRTSKALSQQSPTL